MNQKYLKEYVGFLQKHLDVKKPIKVVIDCSNGVAGEVFKKLLTNNQQSTINNKSLKTVFINDKPDGNFPGHGPNPVINGALDQLGKRVLKEKADLGIGLDGDGDRAILVDNKGRVIWGDQDAYLLVRYLKPKKIIVDPRIGWLIRDLANNQQPTTNSRRQKKEKMEIIDSKVGEFFIREKMAREKADIGFEESGHIYYKSFNGADSGILTTIYAINAVSGLSYTLADFCDLLPQYTRSEEINIKIESDFDYNKLLKNLEHNYSKKITKKSDLDGIRMEFDNGAGRFWFNVRKSNTEPLLRLLMEADSKATLDRELSRLTNLLKKGSK